MIREHKKYICKCVCKENLQKSLKVNKQYSEDLAAAVSLPDQWITQRSGETLMKYLEERENNYKASLASMLKDTIAVNNDIGEKVRDNAEKLYTNIKETHETVNNILRDFMKDKSPKARDVAVEQVEKINDESVKDIEQFKINVLHLEHLRSDGLKCIFQSKFHKLTSIEHYTPENILHDLDKQVCGSNDQLLTNLKAYFDLVCQLRTHLDEIVTHARLVLNQYSSTSLTTANDPNVLENENGGELDYKKIVICLVDACQGTLAKLCTQFYNYLDDLQKNIGNKHYSVKNQVLLDLENFVEDGLQRISNCCTQYSTLEDDDQIRKSIDYAKDSFRGFVDNLLSTYTALYDICHILNALFARLDLARKILLAQVEELQMNNDANELNNEIIFNIALEQMLGAPDIDKAQNQFNVLTNMLQKQDDTYVQHSVCEVNKIKEYFNFVLHAVDVFYLECACYFKAKSNMLYSPNEKEISTIDFDSALLSYSRTQGFLPRTILQDQNTYTSLSNWKNMFLASLETKIQSFRDILITQGQKWIDEKCLILNMRYSLKTLSHAVRKERVIAARNARISEIRSHESRLKSHVDTIHHLIENLPKDASKFIGFDSKQLYPLNYWATTIQDNINLLNDMSDSKIDEFLIDPELKRLKLKSYSLRLLKYRQLFEESVESAANLYKRSVEVRLQSARIANLKLMEEIKLFNEGGCYAVAEAVKTCAVLVKIVDALDSCLNVTMEAVNRCQTYLLGLAEELLLPMMQTANEGSGRMALLEKKKKAEQKKLKNG